MQISAVEFPSSDPALFLERNCLSAVWNLAILPLHFSLAISPLILAPPTSVFPFYTCPNS